MDGGCGSGGYVVERLEGVLRLLSLPFAIDHLPFHEGNNMVFGKENGICLLFGIKN